MSTNRTLATHPAMLAAALAAVLTTTGCPLKLEGRACTSTEDDCVGAYQCIDSVCQLPAIGDVDAGPRADGGLADAGPNDAGALDAGKVDAGGPDAGENDAGVVDSGLPDGGVAVDAGGSDAGTLDAGTTDGGPIDAGAVLDSGVDAGLPDAGVVGCPDRYNEVDGVVSPDGGRPPLCVRTFHPGSDTRRLSSVTAGPNGSVFVGGQRTFPQQDAQPHGWITAFDSTGSVAWDAVLGDGMRGDHVSAIAYAPGPDGGAGTLAAAGEAFDGGALTLSLVDVTDGGVVDTLVDAGGSVHARGVDIDGALVCTAGDTQSSWGGNPDAGPHSFAACFSRATLALGESNFGGLRQAVDVQVDDGIVFLAGNSGSTEVQVMRFDPSNTVAPFAATVDGFNTGNGGEYATVSGAVADESGIYVVGTTNTSRGGGSFDPAGNPFVFSLDADGGLRDYHQDGEPSRTEVVVAVAKRGRWLVLAGHTPGHLGEPNKPGGLDVFVARHEILDNGAIADARVHLFGSGGDDTASDVAILDDGTVVVVGHAGGSLGAGAPEDPFVRWIRFPEQ